MSKKLILFLMVLLFGSANFSRAEVVTIGEGTGTTYYFPIDNYFNYSCTEQIYLAEEIGTAGTINTVSFYYNYGTAYSANNVTMYMKHVTRSNFATSADCEPLAAGDVVWTGNIAPTEAGWYTFTLDTPFDYDGESNLLIAFYDGTSGYPGTSYTWSQTTAPESANMALRYYSDSSNPNPYDLANYSGSKATYTYRGNVQLDITAGGGGVAGEITVHDGTVTNANVPVYGFYADAYLKCEMVYPAAELADMAGGTINSIKFYPSSPASDAWTSTWQVFVSEVADATISDFYGPGTVVYEGTLDGTQAEMEITFNTPYAYNGGNLLIGVYNITTGNYKSVAWYGETVDGASVSGYDYSSLSGISATQRNFLPKTTFAYTTGGGPTEPWDPDYNAALGTIEIVAPENGEQNVNPTTLRWYNAENAAAYMVEFGTVYGNLEMIALGDATGWEGSVNLAEAGIELQDNTRYYWRVTNGNNTGEVSELAVFVTTMPTAFNVRVTDDEIFTDETTIVKWSITGGGIGDLPETHIGSGTNSNSYIPSYSFYNYSLTQQIYTADEIGGAGLINSISFYNSGSTKTRDYDVYMVNTDKETFAGTNDWITVTADDQVFTGSVTMTAGAWTTLTFADPFFFDGTNLAIIVDDNSGSWESGMSCYSFDATSQAIYVYNDYDDYDPMAPTGYTGTVLNEKNQIVINIGAKGGVTENRELLGCNVYVDDVKVNDEPITERQYTLSGLSYNIEDGHSVNVTGVYEIGESEFSNTAYVYVSGYGTATGWVKELMEATPMAGVTVKYDGQDEFGNTVNYQTTTAANGTYTINNIKAGEYTAKAIYAGCETAIEENVVVEYNSTTNVNFYMHEVYTPVYKVYAEEGAIMGNPVADVIWSFNNFTINNGGGGGGGTGNGDTFSVDFEAGLPAGWTTIDNGNPTGYGWDLASVVMSTGYGHNGSADCMVSKSYDNNYGVLYPDNYLVTPQVNIAAGSTFSFYACAQDASYAAEHYGVAISDNATGPWTMVEEWTMTAKEGPKGARGTNEQGNWYQKTVDLSSYAGQKYIAIRHFNCSDQFYLDVDDVELSNGSKRAYADAETCGKTYAATPSREMWDLLATFNAAEGGHYGVVSDGTYIYTSNWGYSGASYNFYKYDMEGNVIEGFNITGCGTLRGMTFDGEYFYGVANSSTVYCVDLANHALVSTFTSAYGAMRCISYDSERDGFWVVGNWSGNLTLINRAGAIVEVGPTPTSASDVAYWKDSEGVERVYCFNNGTNDVDEYNITTGNFNSAVFNFNSTPGYASGSAGGCYVGNYGDKLAFFGDIQQSPNLIGIYELGAAQGGGGGGGSQFATEDHFFRVYRQPVLVANMPEVIEPELLADNYGLNFADTMYTDNAWNSLPAGIYQYGVSAVYPWCSRNDNNVTEIIWSNYIEKDMETTVIVKANVASGFYQGTVFTLTNVNENIEYTITLDEANTDTIADFRKGEYIVTAALAGYASDYNETEVSIWDATTIEATLIEALTPVSSVEVSGTGYARWTDLIPATDVAMSYYMTLDGMFIGETTSCYEIINPALLEVGQEYIFGVAVLYTTGLSDYEYATFTYIGCNAVDPQVTGLTATNEPGDLNVVLTWNGATPTPPTPPTPGTGTTFTEGFEGGMPTGWNVIDANNDGWTWCMTSAIPTTWTYYASLTLDWYRTGSNAICSGSYINGVGALTPDEYLVTPQVDLVAGSTFSFWAAATDASFPADHFGVFVSDNGTSGWTSVQEWTLTSKSGAANGGRESRDGEGAKLGTWYNYSVDLSAYAGQKYIAIRHFNCNDQYIMCVDDIELSAPAKNRDEVTYDFDDSSLQGWTTIDGGSPAGYGWSLASNKMGTGYGHNGSTDCVLSQSYDNNYGVVYPDNYLISPAKATYSQISFYACAQDASYAAEHFGVAVSTGNASASEFTTIQEWTMTGKGEGASVIGRDGRQTRQGTWYQYTVDLSAYAGQEIWVAIRHFNCSDMFYLDVDDITLTTGGGGGGGTATVFTPGKFNILVDGVIVGATSESTYTYEVADYEEHNYTVVYVDADYNISCVVEDENSIDYAAAPLSVDENEVINSIYPNPTSGDLHINATAMRHISVVNAMGQMVYNQDVNADEMVINMAQFEAGVYMVNIITENGSSVKRITVVK